MAPIKRSDSLFMRRSLGWDRGILSEGKGAGPKAYLGASRPRERRLTRRSREETGPAAMVTRLFWLIALASLVGCGAGGRLITPASPEPSKVEVAPPAPDAFRDFTGERVDPGVPFSVDDVGRAVRGVEVLVKLTKVTTSSWTPPGGEEQVEGTAILKVYKGDLPPEPLRIREGDSAQARGVVVKVISAKVDYNDRRMEWLPIAEISVTPAP